LIEQLQKIIEHAWIENDIPVDWITSLQFPIPKVKNPRTVGDYRRISLTSVGYKIYMILLFRRVEEYLEPILPYQAGFIPKRSTSDQIFVLRRILEEKWNEGILQKILA
jgi:hypothetical protein